MAKNKVKGINELKRSIATLTNAEVPKQAGAAMYAVLTLVENRSLEYVPLDTGALLNSRFKEIRQEAGLTIGRIGFVQAYALPLHSPQPGSKMDNWQPKPVPSPGKLTGGFNANARQNWLNIGLEEAWPEAQRAVKEAFAQ